MQKKSSILASTRRDVLVLEACEWLVLEKDEGRMMKDESLMDCGEDFPGETFRVLKEKEIKQFREYRTRCLVLEAWDMLDQR